MIHQIGADGVVFVHREGDFQFRADAVDACDQHRIAHSGKVRAKQTAESADLAEHSRAVGLPDERLNPPLEFVAKIDINSGARVSLFHLVEGRAPSRPFISDPRTNWDGVPGRPTLWRVLGAF